MRLMHWRLHRRVAHTMRRNNLTGPSLHGFYIWFDDIMTCVKRKVYGTRATNQNKVVSIYSNYD